MADVVDVVAWLAVLFGSLGLHRFYLHGLRDPWGWLHPLPTFLGVMGIQRRRKVLALGDGMHQTDGAILHCVEEAGGFGGGAASA